MSDRWLSVIGIGEDGMDGLSSRSRAVLESAEIIIGGDRHHRLSNTVTAERLAWPSPFDAMIETIRSFKGRRLVVLVTGDPLWYSVGARLTAAIPAAEIDFHPQLSAFQWASARMGWSLADVETVTAHGRPAAQVIPYYWPGARVLALTAGAGTVHEIARSLTDHGYGTSSLTVLGALGGPDESRHDGEAAAWAADPPDLPAFNTLAIAVAGRAPRPLARGPGLPDAAFTGDGTMTKQVVRAATLAKLMPTRGAVLWDLGVGCGSVAVEWMRAAPDAVALGIDARGDRLAFARENAERLGAPRLVLIEGRVPDALDTLPAPQGTRPDLRRPDAVFIGGGLSIGVAERALAALKPGGRLVANAVTLESEVVLEELFRTHGGDLTRIAVQDARPVGKRHGWQPAMPVTQWSLVR